ncbi:MAG: LCCL domain-containing protein, partial [Pseudomonadota bacterium]
RWWFPRQRSSMISRHHLEQACPFVTCPIGSARGAPICGSDIYTSDSPICAAAVHAGMLSASTGGPFPILIGPGQSSSASTARNGVTSYESGVWNSSFAFR